MSVRRPFVARATAAATVLACVLISSCAAQTDQATPPSSTTSSFSMPVSSGPPVTVPGLSSPAPSSSEPPPVVSTEPTPAPAPETTEEPAPAPEPVVPAEPPQTEDPADDPADDFQEPDPEQPAPAPAPAPVSGGRTVVIDPGHNGQNAANPGIINAPVDAGFGETKACNTTGTQTNAGYPEHAFTWGVATKLAAILRDNGVTVIMTRPDDDGVGPCVDERAAIGNNANADLVLSIHGDGVDNQSDTGFYVMTAARVPASAAMSARSDQLAVAIRDGLVAGGLSPSNYLGSNGLWDRDDLAGLNLSTRPTVMVESGNMRAASDAALMSSDTGQQKFAQGYANGVLAFLGG
ncbi:MAG: N-acetylmuramoyl-L-alanine amidase [Nakamurella sp.]